MNRSIFKETKKWTCVSILVCATAIMGVQYELHAEEKDSAADSRTTAYCESFEGAKNLGVTDANRKMEIRINDIVRSLSEILSRNRESGLQNFYKENE